MNRRLIALTILAAGTVAYANIDTTTASPAPVVGAAPTAIPRTVPEPTTRAVQLVLKSFGYTIAVDGVYGPQTTDRVTRWQRSNGLTPDGIAGPVTLASLGLDGSPGPSVTRKSVGAITDTVPPPPRSVEDLIRAIWPDDLENRALQIAWRESRYQPGVTSSTGCCHGVFQIHEIHLRWLHLTVDQLFDAETNIRAAYALYQRDGWAPWAL